MRTILYSCSEANKVTIQSFNDDIKILSGSDIQTHMEDLSALLEACVNGGGAVGFVQPFSRQDGAAFWWNDILKQVQQHQRIVFAKMIDGHVVGSVQLIIAMPDNQSHRAEIAKLLVHPDHRRHGYARQLMQAAIHEAQRRHKTLVTLDTRTGDHAEQLYKSVGFEEAGIIPNYALDPDRSQTHATTYMYKQLAI